MRGGGQWLCGVFVVGALATGCGGGGDGPGIVNAPVVVSVTVSQPSVNPIDIGATVQLSADVVVQNGASQGVTWSSSAPSVASVNQSGAVTGVAGGTATIIATSTANQTRTGSVGITVSPPRVVGVALNSGARTIKVAENFAVAATVDVRGTLARTVTFSTSDASKATVSSTDGLTGTVVGVGAGTATIIAASTADATKNATIQVTVTGSVKITGVAPPTVNVRANASVKLVPTVQADPGISSAVTYQTANAAVATVAADGTVTGVAIGTTAVTVRSVADVTVFATVPVTVRSGVTSVSLTPDRDTLRRGGTRQLTLSVVTEAGVSNLVALTSGNPAVVTIDAQSRVTAVGLGQASVRAISAVDPGVGDSTLITVVDACAYFPTLTLGSLVNGAVTDLSCTATAELYSLSLNQQTTISLVASPQFAANFTVLGDRSGSWFAPIPAVAASTSFIIAAPNRYFVRMAAQGIAQRGTFTITATPNATVSGVCNVVATTGVTVTVPLTACSFAPIGRPVGVYNSMNFALLPVFQGADRLTMTVTAPAGIFPLVEVRFGANAAVQAIATGTTLVQSFTAPAVAGYTIVTVSTRDAGQLGNVTVKIEGPPSFAFDSFVFGSGVLAARAPASFVGPRVLP